jgi:ring-1,2-phenylacetyl-CoA epoxidase subunit PaaE
LPAQGIDEAFLCGPEGMIDAVERTLLAAGVARERVHAERFYSDGALAAPTSPKAPASDAAAVPQGSTQLEIVLDGKTHHIAMQGQAHVLDAGLEAGLDLPYSCKSGVCCTCRARVLEGRLEMERNYTLEQWEMDKGFVLTCQARALTDRVVVSYDER